MTTAETKQAIYNSSDVSSLLNISDSTLRKYCLLLEKENYFLHKNAKGQRGFFDNDLIVLRKLIELKSTTDMTLEQAVKAVVAWNRGEDVTLAATEVSSYNIRYDALVNEFKEFREQQLTFNKELLNELKKQQEYIDNRLERRDQIFLESIRESQEARKQLAISEEKRKSWWKFWKKFSK